MGRGRKEERGTEGRRWPRIQLPPWASQNLGLALVLDLSMGRFGHVTGLF